MAITIIDLVVLFLASFRLTRLLVFDDIMESVRAPFFTEVKEKTEAGKTEVYIVPKRQGLKGWIGRMLSCYWCTGVWVSAFCCLTDLFLPRIGGFFLLILAVAGGGALIESLVQRLIGETD
ncbi:DUF1360 domain-containing protein [Bacillus badius]|uniref:Integral membrane protein n=1 Tax=Bacillus badius TaxID=1455 RepID=A0ABR5ASE0_BACBA|nr:DUF1360 domain-containing protein [Bacillus badius]KIL73130.1 Integral membrane protein [Bacillus badius]KIL77674.1 Integral membrane protein [Bacillus badius]MED4718233.1 DUF1360 domain-containing protein [Bacillus badius]